MKRLLAALLFAGHVFVHNVGGAVGPYYTNHRDIIQIVPAALPQNWSMRSVNGMPADDLSRIQAHLFETYMSSAYDIRAALLLGIRQQISALQAPPPSCDVFDYRKEFIRLVAGTYLGDCGGNSDQEVTIDAQGSFALPQTGIDLSRQDMAIHLMRQVQSGSSSDRPVIMLGGESVRSGDTAFAEWAISGLFDQASVAVAATAGGCEKGKGTTDTWIPRNVDIAKKAGDLMADYRDSFAEGECSVFADGTYRPLGRQPVLMEGATLTIGDRVFDLAANLVHEEAVVESVDRTGPEPQFQFGSSYADGSVIYFKYGAFSGITAFLSNSLSCRRAQIENTQ